MRTAMFFPFLLFSPFFSTWHYANSFFLSLFDPLFFFPRWQYVSCFFFTPSRWWWLRAALCYLSQIIIVSPSLPLTPLSPCHITVVVVPKSWSSLRASYCSSPSHRFVWGWPLLWEEDFASKRIPSFPPLPPPSLAFFSSPSRLFLILFLLSDFFLFLFQSSLIHWNSLE